MGLQTKQIFYDDTCGSIGIKNYKEDDCKYVEIWKYSKDDTKETLLLQLHVKEAIELKGMLDYAIYESLEEEIEEIQEDG